MSANDMGNYVLRIYPKLERYLDTAQNLKFKGELLFLTSFYLKRLKRNGFEFDLKKWFSLETKEDIFVKLSIDDIDRWLSLLDAKFLDNQLQIIIESLKVFYKRTSGKATIVDPPVLLKQYLMKEIENQDKPASALAEGVVAVAPICILLETLAIIQVFDTWFNPHYLMNRRSYFNENGLLNEDGLRSSMDKLQNTESDTRTHTLATICFHERCRDLRSEPFWDLDTGMMCTQYDSTGILPLCWAEIWQGLQRNTLAGICPYCGQIYIYPYNNYRKDNCGSKKCKRDAIVTRKGGIEGYREWERSRKAKRTSKENDIGK